MKFKDIKKGMKLKLVSHPDYDGTPNFGYSDFKLGTIFKVKNLRAVYETCVLENKEIAYEVYTDSSWAHAWEPVNSCLKDLIQ